MKLSRIHGEYGDFPTKTSILCKQLKIMSIKNRQNGPDTEVTPVYEVNISECVSGIWVIGN